MVIGDWLWDMGVKCKVERRGYTAENRRAHNCLSDLGKSTWNKISLELKLQRDLSVNNRGSAQMFIR